MAVMPQSAMGTGTYAGSPVQGSLPTSTGQGRGILGNLVDSVMSFRRGNVDPQTRQRMALGMLTNIGKDPSSVFNELIMQEMMYQLLLKQSQQQGTGQQGGGLLSMLGLGGGGMMGGAGGMGGGMTGGGGGGGAPIPDETIASNYGTLY